ncbi:hypothetical protein FQA39_LY08631 [Lamprigera yunnana]|nr:hypothetical protein FQA39_LY08631 [Lamprigera yunnana]
MNNGKLRSLCFKLNKELNIIKHSKSRCPDAIFIEKCTESPIIVIPKSKKIDVIGPPNSRSNLRPIIRQQQVNETRLEQKLRQFQDETQEWNEIFWSKHNASFTKNRESFIKLNVDRDSNKQTLTADEMSEFYKKFLDDSWKTHVEYNLKWYKRNFLMLYLAFRVSLEKMYKLSLGIYKDISELFLMPMDIIYETSNLFVSFRLAHYVGCIVMKYRNWVMKREGKISQFPEKVQSRSDIEI